MKVSGRQMKWFDKIEECKKEKVGLWETDGAEECWSRAIKASVVPTTPLGEVEDLVRLEIMLCYNFLHSFMHPISLDSRSILWEFCQTLPYFPHFHVKVVFSTCWYISSHPKPIISTQYKYLHKTVTYILSQPISWEYKPFHSKKATLTLSRPIFLDRFTLEISF